MQMSDPACRVFGNRRPVHCIVVGNGDREVEGAHHPSIARRYSPAELRLRTGNTPKSGPHANSEKYDISGQNTDGSPPIKRASIDSRALIDTRTPRSGKPGSRETAPTPDVQGTFASWEPCARAQETEYKDFGEFVVRAGPVT